MGIIHVLTGKNSLLYIYVPRLRPVDLHMCVFFCASSLHCDCILILILFLLT
jgi:hypothetical protein